MTADIKKMNPYKIDIGAIFSGKVCMCVCVLWVQVCMCTTAMYVNVSTLSTHVHLAPDWIAA